MASYIALAKFTDQGIRSIKDTVKRADAAKELAKRYGVTMTQIWWTLGKYDIVVVLDAPDDASATAFNLALCSAGNVRTQTLKAFNRDETAAILGKLQA
ncbi:GYD domain-containing protein [Ramlibacter tataouinensis]|uniref:GYD domain-containing protein n=1 Tax=Ramlibacter tataouinensis TaxID=94132 RepID=UPI0022F3BE29|nr:GYD domain-containing protein [Ramlibacter tataouinensis]WBY02561.1 GYD domain-containing protein [Ramlibacter tataouinensis]